jgi:hypothetical protein
VRLLRGQSFLAEVAVGVGYGPTELLTAKPTNRPATACALANSAFTCVVTAFVVAAALGATGAATSFTVGAELLTTGEDVPVLDADGGSVSKDVALDDVSWLFEKFESPVSTSLS